MISIGQRIENDVDEQPVILVVKNSLLVSRKAKRDILLCDLQRPAQKQAQPWHIWLEYSHNSNNSRNSNNSNNHVDFSINTSNLIAFPQNLIRRNVSLVCTWRARKFKQVHTHSESKKDRHTLRTLLTFLRLFSARFLLSRSGRCWDGIPTPVGSTTRTLKWARYSIPRHRLSEPTQRLVQHEEKSRRARFY